MRLNQLRSLCTIVDHGLNISRAAAAMHTSQPGISKQIRLLESELGTPLLKRRTRRVVGLTAAGKDILSAARRILLETDTIRKKVGEVRVSMTVATTPLQARHVILPALKEFVKRHPKTELSIRQVSPTTCAQLVAAGEADIGLAARPVAHIRDVRYRRCGSSGFAILVPPGHPLLRVKEVKLRDLVPYPIITYNPSFRSGHQVIDRFRAQGLEPNIVVNVNVVGSDLIPAYVAARVGIGIVSMADLHHPTNKSLRAIPADHLFEPTSWYVMVLEGRHLEPYQKEFISQIQAVAGNH